MPHDKNGAELKAGDRVTVECVVEEVSATPDHCNVKLKTVEPFHPNEDGNTNWFNTKQVVKVGLVLLAVLLASSLAGAADPPKFTVESKLEPRFTVVESRVAAVEKELADLKAKLSAKVGPAKGWDCGCITFKDRCTCGGVCTCAGGYGVSADLKADPKKGTPNPNPTIRFGERWMTWDGYEWRDAGPYSRAESANPSAAVQWDCSSGVCRPVSSSNAVYGSSGPVYGGSCAGGSCGTPAASYGGVYGGFGTFGGFRAGSSSCGPGGCR